MQQRFTLSLHGIVALMLILLMIASEYTQQSNASWSFVGIDIFNYAVGVLILSLIRESSKRQEQHYYYRGGSTDTLAQTEFNLFRMLLGFHIAFFFLLVGIWFVFGLTNLVLLEFTAIPGGLLVPFLLLQKGNLSYTDVNVHGFI